MKFVIIYGIICINIIRLGRCNLNTSFISKMLNSITNPNQDLLILVAAIITFIVFLKVLSYSKDINSHESKMPNNPDWAEKLRNKLNVYYSFFTTLITLFPLFGMGGTVIALLNLDFSETEEGMESIKNNFFNALTSTAWGIFFSIVFKCLNAYVASRVNDTIEQIQVIVKRNKITEKYSRSIKGDLYEE